MGSKRVSSLLRMVLVFPNTLKVFFFANMKNENTAILKYEPILIYENTDLHFYPMKEILSKV